MLNNFDFVWKKIVHKFVVHSVFDSKAIYWNGKETQNKNDCVIWRHGRAYFGLHWTLVYWHTWLWSTEFQLNSSPGLWSITVLEFGLQQTKGLDFGLFLHWTLVYPKMSLISVLYFCLLKNWTLGYTGIWSILIFGDWKLVYSRTVLWSIILPWPYPLKTFV